MTRFTIVLLYTITVVGSIPGIISANDEKKNEEEDKEKDSSLFESCRRDPLWRVGRRHTNDNDENPSSASSSSSFNPNVKWNECARVTGYTPRDRFWRNASSVESYLEETLGGSMAGSVAAEHIMDCLEHSFDSRSFLSNELGLSVAGYDAIMDDHYVDPNHGFLKQAHISYESPLHSPKVVSVHTSSDDDEIKALEIEHALSEEEGFAIKALAACARIVVPPQFERRAFDDSYGGNDCTFLATILQAFVPGVAAQIQAVARLAWDHANWDQSKVRVPRHYNEKDDDEEYDEDDDDDEEYDEEEEEEDEEEMEEDIDYDDDDDLEDEEEEEYDIIIGRPDPKTLGIHTTEHLSYRMFTEGLGVHNDDYSEYTILVSLSDPSHFGGGEFYLPNFPHEHSEMRIKPERLSAIVFLSSQNHGVRPITGGTRETFATELWRYDDIPGIPRPGGIPMEAFLDKCDREGDDAKWVTADEIEAFVESGKSQWPRDLDDAYDIARGYRESEN